MSKGSEGPTASVPPSIRVCASRFREKPPRIYTKKNVTKPPELGGQSRARADDALGMEQCVNICTISRRNMLTSQNGMAASSWVTGALLLNHFDNQALK